MSITKITFILDDKEKTVTYEATGERAVCFLACTLLVEVVRILMDPKALEGMTVTEVKKTLE